MPSRRLPFIVLLLIAATCAIATLADAYPSRLVKIIVPYPPGAGTDFAARIVGKGLEKHWGKPLVVENRPGAAAIIGTSAAARSEPDGHTLLLATTGTLSINPFIHKNLPYDPIKDFSPVALLSETPFILVVNPSLPVHSVADLIALAKSKNGQLSFGTAGAGSLHHLTAELFRSMAQINLLHVPYNGSMPALTDVIAGHVQMMFVDVQSVLPQIKEGKVRALGVTSQKRQRIVPSIPTIAEAGVPGYQAVTYSSIVAPAGTPKPIVNSLNETTCKILSDPETGQQFNDVGIEPLGCSSPAEIEDFTKSELAKWQKIVQAAGLSSQ